jgi:L-ascorbate metabolism protein UlaG (beta-lactamase superfamily)
MKAQELVDKLRWLGHDSFLLAGPPVIYFDPWRLRDNLPKADVVLVTHEHDDHCSPRDVERIRGPETVIVANKGSEDRLSGARLVEPGDRLGVAGVTIEAVPAYNTNKYRSPGVHFHPKEVGHVGYVVTLDGLRLYFAGDTDRIPEMKDIDCDVALLPVSGTYVMTVDEALDAARDLGPQIVVPMHYGSGIGTVDDGNQFARRYEGRSEVLLPD